MGYTGIEKELISPILESVCLPAELVVKYEIGIRPLKTYSQTGCKSIHLHKLIIVEDIIIYV